MSTSLSPTYKGILLAIGGYSAFSIADICAKWLSYIYSIPQIIATENAMAAVVLFIAAPLLGGLGGLMQRDNLGIHGLRVLLHFGLALVLTYCYWRLPLADSYTMIFTKPFFAALLGILFFAERTAINRWIAIIVGFIGVVVAMRPGQSSFDPFLIVPLIATFFIAVLFMSSKKLKDPTLASLALIPTAGAAVLSFPVAIAMGLKFPDLLHLPIFLLGGVALGTGLICVSLAFRVAAASVVAPFLYVQMIWALILGFIIFGDVPDTWMLAGTAIIVASGLYLILSERLKKNV